MYSELLEVQGIIKEAEITIYNLLECIEKCEKCIKKNKNSQNIERFEIDMMKLEIGNCEKILKKCRGQKELVVEESHASILVDSLFISQSHSPDPKIIEYKKYTEDSFSELNTQRHNPVSGNTLENTFGEISDTKKNCLQKSLKKTCCGLIH